MEKQWIALLAGFFLVLATAHGATAEPLAADTPKQTVLGNTFIAPAGWSIAMRGPETILTAPEGDTWIVLVDVEEGKAKDADAAIATAWKVYKPEASWPLKVSNDRPDKDGWSRQKTYEYQTSPNEKRDVSAITKFAGGAWTVAIADMSLSVAEKRGAQAKLVFDRLLPKGYARESFAGKTAHRLDEARIAELKRFVNEGRKALRIPGVALALLQNGKAIYSGFGVRDIETTKPVDPDTLFMIASNTKALTTLLLAKLVAEGRMTWKTPVTSLLPTFKLGDAETTRQVLVEHLICACTGLPRQDYEMIFQFGGITAQDSLTTLGTMQPTSKFGELFQYSNPMAAAAGYLSGHILYPEMELGAAYDRAMQSQVFDPLGMKSATFDFGRALAANHAGAHAPDIDGHPAVAPMELNYCVIPHRPAGGAWMNVRDLAAYVAMELAKGKLPDGKRYVEPEPLLARRNPQVPMGKDETYGMGLMVDTTYGVTVVHHGGDLFGHHSDMIWLPDHDTGAVIFTNGDPGWILRTVFRRKLLEVLFDGNHEADPQVASSAKTFYAQLAAERKLLTVPADRRESQKLADRYSNPALGDISVKREKDETTFDFGEWKSVMASRRNPDGTISFITTAPGAQGFEFVVAAGNQRRLIIRDAQHEYMFEERSR
jgi:CubicO group peptidase (beta-lactamase class C family)